MFTLYMDNFRGFKDTHLPLKGMNFFVGENSSGKSSALSLIHLLNQEKFWDENQWYFEDYYYFGTYLDITNNSKEVTNIGLYRDKFLSKKSDYEFNSVLMSFTYGIRVAPFITKFHLLGDSPSTSPPLEVYIEYHEDNKSFGVYINNSQFNKTPAEILFEKLNLESIDFGILEYNENSLLSFNYILSGIDSLRIYKSLNRREENNIYWFAPIRTKPQRTYDQYIDNFTADGKHIPYLLRNIVNNKSEGNKRILEAIDEFGKKSGLYEKMIVKQYGESINAPFEIQFQLADGTYRISNVGYGVSQVLPLIVQILADQQDSWFMIQQPEVHLHPKAQSALGEFLFFAFEKGKKIFVETHSDFIIDGFRRKLAESPQAATMAEQAQVVFFEKEGEGNRLNCIDIEADGEYKTSEATERFRSFFVQEALQNIGL